MSTKTASRRKSASAWEPTDWPQLDDKPASAELRVPAKQPTEHEIRQRAYHLWVCAGCPPGDGVDFWCEAEKRLTEEGQTST
jgi:hypothetical protein